jgi:hypothetical protein
MFVLDGRLPDDEATFTIRQLPLLVAELLERSHRTGAGIVHEHIDGAEALLALVNDPLTGLGPGCVEREPLRPRTLLRSGPQVVLAACDKQQARPLRAQHARRGQPDPAAGAVHHARLARQA